MPSTLTYPGIYIEEIPSGVRTITGVSTSIMAIIDFFTRGEMNKPIQITSFMDFERKLGGLDGRSEGSYAILQYYLNDGQIAWVIRVASGTPLPAMIELRDQASSPQRALLLEAASPGVWGVNVQVAIGHIAGQAEQFNLVVRELSSGSDPKQVLSSEVHLGLSMKTTDPRFVKNVLASESALVRVSARSTAIGLGNIPASTAAPLTPTSTEVEDITSPGVVGSADSKSFFSLGNDPDDPTQEPNDGNPPEDAATLVNGMKTLDTIAPEIFNILCLPRAAALPTGEMQIAYTEAKKYCEDKRAFLIIDIPETTNTLEDMKTWKNVTGAGFRSNNAAVYYPRLEIPDRMNENRPRNVGASGTLAGVYARTDSTRGVWKAPAGTEALLVGANVIHKLTDLENGTLNVQGVNILRCFPIFGCVSWGARTMNGANQQPSDWRYIPVRRMALFLEESLYQGLKWVVFEPNDEPLWASIRLNVGAFLQSLFRQGAFQGKTPREAYLVKCDKDTTTQADINNGIVNIVVGFAPLKPAEFVVIKIQQLAGQIPT